MRRQNRHLLRRDLALILAITAIVVASRCLADELQTQPPSSAHDRFPQVSELALQTGLPDPLVMLDGRRVTTREQWVNERRPELMPLFQHYMYGFLPPRPQAGVRQGRARRPPRARRQGHAEGSDDHVRAAGLAADPPDAGRSQPAGKVRRPSCSA